MLNSNSLARIKTIVKLVISSGILIGGSLGTAFYVESELRNMIIASIARTMRHPSIQQQFEQLSEKLIGRMFDDEKNQEKFAIMCSEIESTDAFQKSTLDLAIKIIKSNIVLYASRSYLAKLIEFFIKDLKDKDSDLRIQTKSSQTHRIFHKT